jgi:hypothetical protein
LQDTCGNCGAPRAGDYCARCGQHFLDRLSVRLFVDELLERVSVDRGLFRTVREMTVDPGGVIRRYLTGQRRRYVSPLTYFLVGTGLLLLTFQMYEDVVLEWARARMDTSSDDTPLLSPEQRRIYAEMLVALYAKSTYATLAMCVPFALAVRLLFRRSAINVAEALVFSLFTNGQIAIVQAAINPALYLFIQNLDTATMAGFAVTAVVLGHAAAGFFGRPLRSAVKVAIAYTASFLVFSVLASMALLAYVKLFR